MRGHSREDLCRRGSKTLLYVLVAIAIGSVSIIGVAASSGELITARANQGQGGIFPSPNGQFGNHTYITDKTPLNHLTVTLGSSILQANSVSDESLVIAIASPAEGTLYIAVVGNASGILSPTDFSTLNSKSLPTGISVSFELPANARTPVQNSPYYIEVPGLSSLTLTARIHLNGAAGGNRPLNVVVFEAGNGFLPYGQIQEFELEVTQ